MKQSTVNLLRYPIKLGNIVGITTLLKFRKKTGLVSVKPPYIKYPITLRANTSDFMAFDEMFVANQYDFDYNFTPKIIVDCGANIGLSAIFFKNKFPESRIISIEPECSNYNLLEKNVAPYEDIICVKAGIWSKDISLKGSEKYGTEKWTFSVEENADVDNRSEHCKMEGISIDKLMEKFALGNIDLLKIDIEGAELEVFSENYERWLPNVKCIVIELHDRIRKGTGTAFFKAMSQYDFSYHQKGINTFCFNNHLLQ